MMMLAAVTAFNVDALNTLSSSSCASASCDFSTLAVSAFDDGSSAIFLQNSADSKIRLSPC